MLKKRLIGVITVKDGWGVQSFGYRRHLPLGRPECLAENFDRWGADEILVISIDRTRRGLGPDLDLLRRLGRLGLSTPLTYGGGIRDTADARSVIQSGAERLCVDALLKNRPEVSAISAFVGAQAVIGVLPLSRSSSGLQVHDYLHNSDSLLDRETIALFKSRIASEALVIDWRNEGASNAFDMTLVDDFPLDDVPLIVFGGISEAAQLDRLYSKERVVAAGVGNFLSYREHAIQNLKRQLDVGSIRQAFFQRSY